MNEAIAKHLNIKSNYVYCYLIEPTGQHAGDRVCDEIHPFHIEMFLGIGFLSIYNHPFEQPLVSFNFENYAGFLIPPGEKLFDKIVFQ
jgi:hypothetical protein